MASVKDSYLQLVSLAQLFLLREFELSDTCCVSTETFHLFKNNFFSKEGKKVIESNKSIEATESTSKQQSITKKNDIPSIPIEPVIKTTLPATKVQEDLQKNCVPPSQQIQEKVELQSKVSNSTSSKTLAPTPVFIEERQNKSKKMSLEPFTRVSTSANDTDLSALYTELFPEVNLSEQPPSDLIARKLKNGWQNEQMLTPVIILSYRNEGKKLQFLKNIALAIQTHFAPARVISIEKIEKENAWEEILNSPQLRLVIATDYELFLQPHLMRFYQEFPEKGKHFLNQTPLLLLSDLSLYLKESKLKSLLWRAISNEFAVSPNLSRLS